MSWRIPRVCCGCYATRSASNSMTRCSLGHPVCAKPTAPGPNIGIPRWQNRHRFSHTRLRKVKSPGAFAIFTNVVASVTNGFMNVDYEHEHEQEGKCCRNLIRRTVT